MSRWYILEGVSSKTIGFFASDQWCLTQRNCFILFKNQYFFRSKISNEKKNSLTLVVEYFSQNKWENLSDSVRISDLKSLENFIFSLFFPFFMLIANSFGADLFGTILANSLYGHYRFRFLEFNIVTK